MLLSTWEGPDGSTLEAAEVLELARLHMVKVLHDLVNGALGAHMTRCVAHF
jgi:hypothetical protein